MFAASRRMTFRDFLLLGSSVAVLIVVLWPANPDRQWMKVQSDDGEYQRYSVAVDDPSLVSVKLRLKKWETPPSSRALRTARWHQELADFYSQYPGPLASQIDAGRSAPQVEKSDKSVSQVSFVDSRQKESTIASTTFWTDLSKASSTRIVQEEQRIRAAHEKASPPVLLGPVVRSARPAAAYPFALFAALATILLSSRRQSVRPPIELACQVERPVDFTESQTICLRIPPTWVRIRQPTEVVVWRIVYAAAVLSAFVCLALASFW